MKLPTLDRVVEAIGAARMVGIVGPPGAGKSTIAAALASLLPDAALLPMDGFHLPQERLVELGRRDRMGAPDTFDVEGFVATLQRVRTAVGVETAPAFARTIEEPVPDAISISPASLPVLIEGNYLLLRDGGWERVAPLLDVTFFVEVPDDIRHDRLIARHIAFGKSEADAAAWVLGPDEANARLVTATAARADHVIALDG